MVGAGGWPAVWIRRFLPAFTDRLDVVAVVDANPVALAASGDRLGLAAAQRFGDMETAFAATEADFCILAVPPAPRLQAVTLAAAHGLPMLCEKPIADSWENTLAIARTVREADVKLSVVQNYRYTRKIVTLKRELTEGSLGRISSVHCRFAADYTPETAGGAFRHQIPDAMIYEGAEHHLDQFRNLAGADCDWISGAQWNPPWSRFGHTTCAMFQMRMTNGVMGQYHMTHLARGEQNGWHEEYYRVECEHGDVVVDRDGVVRVVEHLGDGYQRVTECRPVGDEPDGHFLVIDEFLRWLDGGPAPQTALDDNLRTAALTFAAVEASRTNSVVDVAGKLAEAGPEVS
jgi:predicted dehydrogenase